MNNTSLSVPASTVDFCKTMGEAFAKSGMFGCKNVESGMVLALTCAFERKPPTEIARRYHLIDGRLSMKSGAMLADFCTVHGGKHRVLKRDHDGSVIELSKDGETKQFSITWEEIKDEPFTKDKNGKTKHNYATPRARMQMMWARLVSDSIEAFCPAVSYGVYTPEEVSDFEEINAGDYRPVIEGELITHPGPTEPDTQTKFIDTHAASVECPVTQAELEQIVGLIKEILPYQADIKDKIVAKISPRKLNDLTQAEAAKLIEPLKALAAKHRLAGQ